MNYIIIPAYNEGSRIRTVVREAKKHSKNIVVVDDGSTDTTAAVAKRAGAVVLQHIINLGKGAAMKTGAEYALSKKATNLVFLDGDGQHKPNDVPVFLRALKKHDIVFGQRKRSKNMPFVRRFGNWLIAFTVKNIYDMHLEDCICGYRAFTANAYKKLRWKSRAYGVECEMIARAGKHNLSYASIPVATIYLDKHKGMTIFDGIRVMFYLIWWRMTH
ncbi:MAG: glycosyltransferase family 2 protein [Candidatus Woesearchaeota archaeon]|nr:glycosyltransferase family 2 protein [Candidatus Woesearchaeota archaeon]